MGYRTIIARCVQNGVSHRCVFVNEVPRGVSNYFGGALQVSRDMGYRSDSIAISRDMGPLSV